MLFLEHLFKHLLPKGMLENKVDDSIRYMMFTI